MEIKITRPRTSPYDPARIPSWLFVPALLLIFPIFALHLTLLVSVPYSAPYPCAWLEALVQTVSHHGTFIVLIVMHRKAASGKVQSPLKQFCICLAGTLLGCLCMWVEVVHKLLYLYRGEDAARPALIMLATEVVDIAVCFPCSVVAVLNACYFVKAWWTDRCSWKSFYMLTATVRARRLSGATAKCAICLSRFSRDLSPMYQSGRKTFHESCFTSLFPSNGLDNIAGFLTFAGMTSWELLDRTIRLSSAPDMGATLSIQGCTKLEPVHCSLFYPHNHTDGAGLGIDLVNLMGGEHAREELLTVSDIISNFFRLARGGAAGFVPHYHRSMVANDTLYHSDCDNRWVCRYDPGQRKSYRVDRKYTAWVSTVVDDRFVVSLEVTEGHGEDNDRYFISIKDLIDEESIDSVQRIEITAVKDRIDLGGWMEVRPGVVRISQEDLVFDVSRRELTTLAREGKDPETSAPSASMSAERSTGTGEDEDSWLKGSGIELVVAR